MLAIWIGCRSTNLRNDPGIWGGPKIENNNHSVIEVYRGASLAGLETLLHLRFVPDPEVT